MLTPHDIGLPSTFPTFRADPRTSTDQLDLACDVTASTARVQIIGAPPGLGKTLVNLAVGLLHASTNKDYRILYLVNTNSLLEQVYEDFKSIGLARIIGMGNYVCNDTTNTTGDTWGRTRTRMCNEGKCLSGYQCDLRNDGCDYHDSVRIASTAQITLSNFAYRASCAKYSDPTNIGEYDLVICDEAHLLLDWLTSFCAIKLDKRTIKKLLSIDLPNYDNDLAAWSRWANDQIEPLLQLYRDKRHALSQVSSSSGIRQLDEIKQLGHDLRTLSRITSSNDYKSKWVVEPWKHGVEITPVEPGEFLEQYIYLNAPKVILSSASITEADAPSYYCGDDYSSDYEYHQGGNGFPVRHRPLVWVQTCTVKHRMPQARKRLWMLQIDSLCEHGKDYRGIIQTVSYDRMYYIYNNARENNRARMIIHRGNSGYHARDRTLPTLEQALEIFYSTPCAILLSPNVGTGHDFKYDRARWQVICKVPFLNPTSPIVRARKKLWKSKYGLDYMTITAAKTVLQYYGRIVRARDDWGYTYVVDDAWGKYVGKSKVVPMYVKNAMSTVWSGLPPAIIDPTR